MERAIKEKMTTLDVESAMPQDLINAKPLTVSLKDFFAKKSFKETVNGFALIKSCGIADSTSKVVIFSLIALSIL